MIPKITAARLRRPALLTSAGFVVSLLAAPWPAAPAPGGIRPSRIASTAQVPSPAISSGAGGGVAPALIASTAIVGAPALAVAAIPTISPAKIAAGAAVGAPVIANGSSQPVAPPALGPSSVVPSPMIVSAAPGAIAAATIVASSVVGSPSVQADPMPVGFARNGSTNPATKAMLAGVKAGTRSGIIGVNGDSTNAGAGGGGSGNVNQQLANARQYRPSTVLAQLLTAAGYPTVDSMVVGDNGCAIFGVNLTSYDPRVAAGTNWPGAGGQTYAGGGYLAGQGNGLWEFTPLEPVTGFEVIAYNTGGAFGFAVDGSVSGLMLTTTGGTIINNNVAIPNTGSGFTRITMQAGALGSHKFQTIITDQGNGGTPQLRSVRPISPGSRIEVFNRASSGAQSFEQAATGNNWLNADALAYDAADLQLINVGLNDAGQGASIATTRTSIQRLIDKAKLSGDVLLIVPNAANPSGFATQAAQDAVRAAILDLAATNNVAVCDLRAKFGEWDVVAPRTADNLVHPGRAFYADIAAYINDCIMAMAK